MSTTFKINPLDPEWQEIDQLKAAMDFTGLGHKVQQLMKMPQSLCKVRGNCCRVATFKGNVSLEQLRAIAESDDPDAQNARDFITLFIPYESLQAVRSVAPTFVDRVMAAEHTTDQSSQTTFFHCRFLGDNGGCMVHEDRPTGCRAYPFPHEKTIYHPGCGFEAKGIDNWNKIQYIMAFYDEQMALINTTLSDIQEQTDSLLEQVAELLPDETP